MATKHGKNGNRNMNPMFELLAAQPVTTSTSQAYKGNANKYYGNKGKFDAESFFEDNDDLWGNEGGSDGGDAIVEVHVIDADGHEYVKTKHIKGKKKKHDRSLPVHPNQEAERLKAKKEKERQEAFHKAQLEAAKQLDIEKKKKQAELKAIKEAALALKKAHEAAEKARLAKIQAEKTKQAKLIEIARIADLKAKIAAKKAAHQAKVEKAKKLAALKAKLRAKRAHRNALAAARLAAEQTRIRLAKEKLAKANALKAKKVADRLIRE